MSNSTDTSSKKQDILKSTITVAITLLVLLIVGVIAMPVVLMGANTYAWALSHGRQVKMLQSTYTKYDNSFSLQSPKQ